MEYNIYCDESCHLPHDKIDLMVIGGISCPKEKAEYINKAIRDIKVQNGVYKFAEIKWTKVSESKYKMYEELLDLFFDTSYLTFRAVVALNKSHLNYEKFHLTHDDWYQRIYYLTLREIINIGNDYHVYVDIKDTKGSAKINQLKDVLNNVVGYFYDETVRNIQLVRSDQIQLLQLADLFIGAVAYSNRGLYTNSAKLKLIGHIEDRSNRILTKSTPKTEDKINIFKWLPRED
ncbi:MAG: DUF3800 domain-containing protein [Lachnospiraceae bacterium]|nr:DUF3800 domain-containing protein [Lachnospiraceae bacterium]